jgi:hypothetical protein
MQKPDAPDAEPVRPPPVLASLTAEEKEALAGKRIAVFGAFQVRGCDLGPGGA